MTELQLPPGCEWRNPCCSECAKSLDDRRRIAKGGYNGVRIEYGPKWNVIEDDPRIVLPVLERRWRDEVERQKEEFERTGDNEFDYILAGIKLAAVEAAWKALKGAE